MKIRPKNEVIAEVAYCTLVGAKEAIMEEAHKCSRMVRIPKLRDMVEIDVHETYLDGILSKIEEEMAWIREHYGIGVR